MVRLQPLPVGDRMALGIEVELPRTRLVVAVAEEGYLMCGALDVQLLDERLRHRSIVAARAVGVRTLDELLAAPVESATAAAMERGVRVGQRGSDALLLMF